MKVKSVKVAGFDKPAEAAPRIVRVEVSGPFDQNDAVLRRARELVRKTGSAKMLESFDWAIQNEVIATNK